MNFEAIKKAAQDYRPAMAKFLRDMIAIPSESCQEEGVVRRRRRPEVDPPGQEVAQTSRVAAILFQKSQIIEKRLDVPLQTLSISRQKVDVGTVPRVEQTKDAVELLSVGRRGPRFDALLFEIGDIFRHYAFMSFLGHLVAPF